MKRKREGKETKMAASTSCTRDGDSGKSYEVFLNFRGPDTRLTIADSLYHAMDRVEILTFKDDKKLRVGKEIGGSLLQAIKACRIYIPIFSKNYAKSKWCLRELAYMVKLWRDDDEKEILPIFYDVDPDVVKFKTGSYRKALQKHERVFGKDLAKQWKEALREVSRIKGWNLKDHGLHELINLVVEEVSRLLCTRRTNGPDHLVGIEDRMDEIMKRLDLGAFDARFIVIHGMGGIGKTTLAKAIFRRISPQFQGHCCFLEDVRTNGILNLQKKLLSEIVNLTCTSLSCVYEGANMIQKKFNNKKVFIVLDDIDKQDQIQSLAGHADWFGGGSRIIITTRTIDFLVSETEDDNASHYQKASFYEMQEMDPDDALQLFYKNAFGLAKPPLEYIDISGELIYALGRLPLALSVVGSTLRGKSRSTWGDLLGRLKKVIDKDVKERLMISYDALDFQRQQIFLDIACFFINQEKAIATKFWDAIYEYPTRSDVKFLANMSLIKITNDGKLWMHDQLRDLGRNIVDSKSGNNDQRDSRYWSPEDAIRVVQSKKGTERIVALNLGTPTPDMLHRFKREEFARLVNLKFLRLDHGNFEGDFEDLFSELRWLSWSNCPSEFQATNFGSKNLAVLELSGNNIIELSGGWSEIMVAKQLKVLILVDCPALRETPKFSSISRLERLILRGCTRLKKIDESIGNLQHLDHLVIESAVIESLPKSIGSLKSLTELRVTSRRLSMLPDSIVDLGKLKRLILSCPELQELPNSIGQLESLLELDVSYSRIQNLPCSIGNLGRLKILTIPNMYLERLPDSIRRLQSLVELDVGVSRVKPDCIKDLKKLKVLKMSVCGVRKLPKSIGMLENLEVLHVTYLEGEIPSEISALSSLKVVNLSGGRFRELPTTINQLTNLQTLELGACRSIQQLPELPQSLMELSFSWDSLTTIPDFSNLSNLVRLHTHGDPVLKEPHIEGLERLRSLRDLTLHVGRRALAPTDLSSLSQLQSLNVSYADSRSLISLPSNLQYLTLTDVWSLIDWSLFSNLENLSTLSIQRYSLEEIQFEVPGKLRKFNELGMKDCPLLKTLAVLPGLEEIRRFSLSHLPQLTEIQGLGELKSLQTLSIANCDSIKILNESDLSNIRNLKILDFHHCESLEEVPCVPKSCELFVNDRRRFNGDEEFENVGVHLV